MPTVVINGKRVKVGDEFLQLSPEEQDAAVDEIAQSLGRQAPAQSQAAPQAAVTPQLPHLAGASFNAATEGSHAGMMGGFDDEITAGMLAPVDAAIDWYKGDGFDMGRAYARKQQALDAQKAARRGQHPVASGVGELAGGLALGAGASKAGLTLAAAPQASMAARIGTGALEGAGYGALYGAGEAKPGERLSGAGSGALIGGGVGGAVGAAGGALANRAAKKMLPAAPAVDDLSNQARALYTQADQAGIVVKPQAVDHLANNIQFAAGRLNKDLRPNTAGIVDDVLALKGKPLSLGEMDELRQVVGQSMKRAQPQDVRTLERIKTVLDNFADNAKPADITGDIRGFEFIKEARKLWARKAKTEIVEELMDAADVATGKYTQSQMANTIRQKMAQLYRNKPKLNGFTKDEQALIRQMAKGGSNSKVINLFAKFAPRGVVSALAGPALGGAVAGPAGAVAAPIVGHMAGRAADRGAMAAANQLRDAAARGFIPRPPQLPNQLAPLIPAAVETSTGIPRILGGS
jgi:tellurite resistance protein